MVSQNATAKMLFRNRFRSPNRHPKRFVLSDVAILCNLAHGRTHVRKSLNLGLFSPDSCLKLNPFCYSKNARPAFASASYALNDFSLLSVVDYQPIAFLHELSRMFLNNAPFDNDVFAESLAWHYLNDFPNACAVISADWQRLVYGNRKFAEVWQQSGNQQPALEWLAALQSQLPDRTPHTGTEISLPDGRTFGWHVSAVVVPETQESALLCVLEDLTRHRRREAELTQAKAQLEEALAAKQTYLSTMTHELRTPMNAVIAMAHLLAEDNPQPHQAENLKTLKASADNLLTLINDILDYSKIEARKVVFEQTVFQLDDVLKNARRASLYRAEEKGVRIDVYKSSQIPPHLVGDPSRLLQVLNNLVSNAVKFTEQGSVLVEAELESRNQDTVSVHFTVSDTGIGIAPERLNVIFDAYTQAGSDTSRKFGGTGLGLAITKRLIEMQNSRISVKSKVGYGTSFTFSLVFKVADKPVTTPPARARVADPDWRTKQILLVEDNEVNIMVATKFLKSWGLQPDYARNGREALERVEAKQYDLVLMDIQMPVMDGFEATRRIRLANEPHLQQMPIIALTANALDEVRDRCLANGMNDFVSKPFTPDGLHACLCKYLPSQTMPQTVGSATSGPADIGQVPDYARYVWHRVAAISAEDAETQQHLFTLSVDNLRQFKADYQEALLQGDPQRLEQLLHKTRTLFHMLALEDLETEARAGFRLLSIEKERQALVEQHALLIRTLCDKALA